MKVRGEIARLIVSEATVRKDEERRVRKEKS